MPDLYIALLARLHEDATHAINALIKARGEHCDPISALDLVYLPQEGQRVVRVRSSSVGWLLGFAGEPGATDLEALCNLVEKAAADIEAAGGAPPNHLLLQLEHDAKAIVAYRKIARRVLRGGLADMLYALDELGEVEEADGTAGLKRALELAVAESEVRDGA